MFGRKVIDRPRRTDRSDRTLISCFLSRILARKGVKASSACIESVVCT